MIKANFKWNTSGGDLLHRLNLERGGLVQKALTNAIMKFSVPYCPMETGTLSKSPYAASNHTQVIYPGPYARYQYYGEVYGPNIPVFDDNSGEPARFFSPPGQKKHPTGRKLQYNTEHNPLAGSHWVERMKADRMKDVEREVIAACRK
jgi:Minor capsid.